ncbi:hypothetical protein ACPYO6_07270 [Georgenia sp. Z1344]|uniref:hypothetical protein n=1 Tax=Georgenia sp. Z1344 TaxID=3416706 RepID=UPI003CF9DD19
MHTDAPTSVPSATRSTAGRGRRARAAVAVVLLAAGLAACDDPVGPTEDPTVTDPTDDPEVDAAYPADLEIEVESLSGSVPPPHDSLETVTVGPDGITYTAGSRYEDEPRFTETVDAQEGDLEEVMAAWEALEVPADTGDGYDDSHSSGGVGGSYVIAHVSGTGYNSAVTGDDDAIFELVEIALDQVPAEVRSEGESAIEEYNASDEG